MQRYSGFGLFKHSLSHHENWQKMWRTPMSIPREVPFGLTVDVPSACVAPPLLRMLAMVE